MPNIFPRFLLLCIAFAGPAHSYELLKKSELLQASGVHLFIGEQQTDAIVFFNDALDELKIARDGSNVLLVSAKGAASLKGKNIKRDINHACGEGDDATGFIRTDKRDIFVATGAEAPTVLKWHPAQSVPFPKTNCFDDVLSLGKVTEQYAHSFPTTSGIISTMLVRHDYSKEEKLFRCATSPMERHDPDEVYIVPADECMKNDYGNHGYLRRSVYSEGNMCRVVLTVDLNDEAMPVKEGDSIEEFLGTLEISYKKQKETWLFWNSPGYEGAGIYAIKIEDLKKREKPSAEWLVYTGC